MATSMATTAVRDDPANKAPEFKDSSAQRFVMENTAAGYGHWDAGHGHG